MIIDLTSEVALSVSIILGIAMLLASIPGAIVFWSKTERALDRNSVKNDDVLMSI